MTCIFKIGNMTDTRQHGRSSKWANRRDGEQDFPLPALLHNLADFSLQLFQMVLDETQFFDEQFLFKQKTLLARKILCPNADAAASCCNKIKSTSKGRFLLLTSRSAGRLAVATACGVGNLSRRSNAIGKFGFLKTWVNSGKSSSQMAVSLFFRCVLSLTSSYRWRISPLPLCSSF
jgi:hypothetical protein